MKTIALILFIATYVMLLIVPKYRAFIALGSASIFVILGMLPVNQVFGAVDWNVLFMILGTMGTVALFIESKMPSLLADIIIKKSPNVKWAIISLALFAGIISAFVDNVATVLMVAPVALTIAKKLKISPVPIIIAIAISSNLQGAATLVGDTTSILLGSYARIDFFDFFFFKGRMGLFFVVQIAAIAATLVLLYIFRKETKVPTQMEKTVVTDYFPTVLLLGTILSLIVASFFPDKPAITNGVICVGVFIIGLIKKLVTTKDFVSCKKLITEIDYLTILLLAGLFVVIGGITHVGLIEDISNIFVHLGNNNLFLIYTIVVWASVFFSAFIDNIPYVATMLPVVSSISTQMGIEPYLLYFGLLIGATLGGNLTPIGASANITALGILKKDGYAVKNWDFMKISIPFTLSAVTVGYILIWFLWK